MSVLELEPEVKEREREDDGSGNKPPEPLIHLVDHERSNSEGRLWALCGTLCKSVVPVDANNECIVCAELYKSRYGE